LAVSGSFSGIASSSRARAQCLRLGCRWRAAYSVGCDGSPSAARRNRI
jgi:hypothetical protein